jgi:hypothetical protein
MPSTAGTSGAQENVLGFAGGAAGQAGGGAGDVDLGAERGVGPVVDEVAIAQRWIG